MVKDNGTGPSDKKAVDLQAYVDKQKLNDSSQIMTLRGRGLTQIVATWTDELSFKDNSDGGITVHILKNLLQEEQL